MSDVAIRVEDVSKLYQLGEVGTGTLSRDIERWWASVRGKEDPFAKIGQLNDRTTKAESEFVWALKDINFEVKKGEVLGIIGRNGAGKSTLLKILSKITSPTKGKIYLDGRIASLLEVGTGFHPEMTGRENIFMNGAILGMRKKEIQKKFDAIVDFAGVEKYIDTPVKRYSSGMYVRLAFAVAAFLEPEILIVDEVLAVGDAEFQKKCLGRMKDVSVNEGRTVLFVSHNMEAIRRLCDLSLVMEQGQINFIGEVYNGIDFYNNASSKLTQTEIFENEFLRINSFEILTENNISLIENDLLVKCAIFFKIGIKNPVFGIIIKNRFNYPIASTYYNDFQEDINIEIGKEYFFEVLIPKYSFATGEYSIELDIGIPYKKKLIDEKFKFNFKMTNKNGFGSKYVTENHPFLNSIMRQAWKWTVPVMNSKI